MSLEMFINVMMFIETSNEKKDLLLGGTNHYSNSIECYRYLFHIFTVNATLYLSFQSSLHLFLTELVRNRSPTNI